MITSDSNPKIKYIYRLNQDRRFRQQEKQFVVEGTRWVKELVEAQLPPTLLLATEEWVAQNPQLAHLSPLLVTTAVLKHASDTQTPAGVLAVAPQPALPWPVNPTFLLFLDTIRDPGNLGTILRSAAAAGVEGVWLSPGCVDPFNSKVVRSSMGAILRLPIQSLGWEQMPNLLTPYTLYLADGEAQTSYTAVDWQKPAVLLVGSEAEGASSPTRQLPLTPIAIPMQRQTESLNAAMAASIILFEAARQKGLA